MSLKRLCAIVMVGGWLAAAATARAQVTYSIDFQGPPMGAIPPFGGAPPISEADILVPAVPGMLPVPGSPIPPGRVIAGGFGVGIIHLGVPLYGAPPVPAPGVPGLIEVDALSYGRDYRLMPAGRQVISFSVDEFAVGLPIVVMGPSVATEGAAGAGEASGDVFVSFPPGAMPPLPIGPGAFLGANTQLFDGNGVAPPGAIILPLPAAPLPHGMSLPEPNPPTPGALPDFGANLDALDVNSVVVPGIPVFYSLDSGFIDPIEGAPANSGSAVANGFVSGSVVLVRPAVAGPAPAPIVYAPPPVLGLDLGGAGTDDLDALAIVENGIAGYQPSMAPFDWLGGATDMLLFSVRRGSAVIGAPDSIFGAPIEEGDILTTPLPPALGGVSPFPGILIAAEAIGLATVRSGFPTPFGFGDDLDALDVSEDCNGNAIPDPVDMGYGILPPAETPGLDCADGLDNDCDGLADCADADCATDPACMCGNGMCDPGENPCNCPIDCGLPPPAEIPGATCQDMLDNDCDGPRDCADPDCATDPACLCGNGMCDPGETPCNCPIDCGVPPVSEMGQCADMIDNDCDMLIDCADPDCAMAPACLCGNGICGPGENPCNCPADCGPPAMNEVPNVTCQDGLDNDCDLATDCADPDCATDPACLCGDGMCVAPENPCNCMADCGPPVVNEAGLLCGDMIDNDCDGFIDCADPSCAALPLCICGNGVCNAPVENPCNCPVDCGPPALVEVPGATCGDGIDNDCDGPIDCADPDCAPDPLCLCGNGICGPGENSCNCPVDCGLPVPEGGPFCGDTIDNDCDGFIDCMDPGCFGSPLCACGNGVCSPPENPCTCPADCGLPTPMETGLCADLIDNDCDGPIDCADPDCAMDPACQCGNGMCTPPENPCTCPADCGPVTPNEIGRCADTIDNDCDGPADCADPDCAGDPACLCGNGMCVAPENPCNCGIDCGPIAVSEAGNCTDGIDNDCDGPIDCADGDCASDPACLCGNGMCVAPENPCTCPADCGPILASEIGRCTDGIDNDCDGPIDCQDVDCVADPACLCGNGMCTPPENPCNCGIDCGPIGVDEVGACADTIDNDCDGQIDCADADCAGDPACVCGDGICSLGENSCNCPMDCPGLPCNGDVNGDGAIDQIDLLIVGQCVDCAGPQIPACDVNCDGTIDLLDFGDELCLLYSPPAQCCPVPHGACTDTNLVQSCVLVPGPFCATIGGTYLGDGVACPPGTGDCNGNGIGDGCEQNCTVNTDCNDMNVCTCDRCVCGVCVYQPVMYGDVNCDCIEANLDDILCVLQGFQNYALCPASDIYPPCTGEGIINVDDILAVLSAFAGTNPCFVQCMTPCPQGACCDGVSCSIKTATNCLLGGDVYKGDGTACPPLVPNPCP